MTTTATVSEFIQLAHQYGAHNYHPLPIVLVRGEGIWVWDEQGRRYLDMLSAYSALNHGHRHPRIVAALKAQADKLTLTSRAFYNDSFGPQCEKLCKLAGKEQALLMNSGAEAVETAIKAARKWGYKQKGVAEGKARIVVAENNFHGRTTTIVGFSSEAQYRDGFGPFTPGFVTVPYGDVAALKKALNADAVAFLVEPIQGEAGILIPPDGYLRAARQACDAAGALLVADEIQTGFGRTGRTFACEHEGVVPDIYIVGKALGGGLLPVSGIICDRRIMDVFTPGDHGSTFGGNPLACAVGLAALEVLVDEGLARRSAELGAYFLERLRSIKSPHIKDVRGRGLLVGVEVKTSSGPARPFCEALMEEGILAKETHHQVIRFAPPLVISRSDLDWALERIDHVLTGGGAG